MAKYKPDQGTYARTTALLLLSSLVVFGCHTLYYWLLSFRGEEGNGLMIRELTDGPVPVLGLVLTPALIVAIVVGAGLLWTVAHLLNKPKAAEMLIECETEMRKCTWPSVKETITASMVILVVMLFFTGSMALFDFILNGFMTQAVFR